MAKEITLKKGQVILGIDLGTTNSCVCYVDHTGKREICVNAEGARTTPSVVYYTKDGQISVGQSAKNAMALNPGDVIYEVKRLIGKTYSEFNKQKYKLSYEVIDQKGSPCIKTQSIGIKTPIEVSSQILMALVKDAKRYIGSEVEIAGVVITVPAYFNDDQRKATKTAGEVAGLKVLRIINEPTAAALAYSCEKSENSKILVYDLGGGTFDVSILSVGDGVVEVRATGGDNCLGGADFDAKIMQMIIQEIQAESGVIIESSMPSYQSVMSRIKDAAEDAKIQLSRLVQVNINIPFLFQRSNGAVYSYQRKTPFTLAQLTQLVQDLTKRTIDITKQCLEEAGLKFGEIDKVLLVGGMTRCDFIIKAVKNFFNKEPNATINPDEIVAIGAAVQGAILCDYEGKDASQDILLIDVTPLNLGLETLGGIVHVLIPGNTAIPAKKSQIYTTAADNQQAVSIRVFQGNRTQAMDNKLLGQFDLHGIPPARRGVPQIEVTFEVDANGIVIVSAKELTTGVKQSITISDSNSLSKEDIRRMQEEAEKYRDEDEKRQKSIELVNNADHVCFNHSSLMEQYGAQLPAGIKDEIDGKVKDIQAVLDSIQDRANISDEVAEDLKNKVDTYQKSVTKIYEAMQQMQQQSGAAGQQGFAQEEQVNA